MKLALCLYGSAAELLPMVPTKQAFVGGHGDSGAGYKLDDDFDFIPDDGEYLQLAILLSMYEGGEAAGSYKDWSWAVIPETAEEAAHLAKYTNRTLYRTDT